MGYVIIGMDPHKRPATIEVIDGQERSSRRAGLATTATVTRRCWLQAAGSRTGPGP